MRIALSVNGSERLVEADPHASLLDILRDDLGLFGAKYGCGAGQCGACCVLLDGRSVPACTLPVGEVGSRAVITVEGLAASGPNAVQEAFVAEGAMQCGYCTPGLVVAATALLAEVPRPSDVQIQDALGRHLCRCGVYGRVIRAVHRAAGEKP